MECFKNMKYRFTDDEYNALQNITGFNGMDCWFCIKQSKDGLEYIYDLEERKRLSISTALSYIYEGLLDEDFDALDDDEQIALDGLFKRFVTKKD